LGRRVQHLRQQSLVHLDQLFGPLLPPELLSQTAEGANSRQRVFSVRRTFFGFLYQVLNPDCPCREIVRQIQALFALHGGGPVDSGSSAYCQARARMPWDILPRLRCAAAAQVQKASQLWRGLSVKVIDGTSTSLPDTGKNQRAYPQTGSQKPGCGFPLLKLVGVFCLSTGALLDYAKGNKHQHELALLQKLLPQFKPGDLALADRGFSSYTLLGWLWRRGVWGLFRLHHARPADLRKGKRLGRKDRLMVWRKPCLWQKPRYLPKKIWNLIPLQLTVRVVRFTLARPGFRSQSVTLVTTLLDAQAYPAEELARLYAQRWQIELWFRDIKTSMGMEVLRCKSPKMVHKELEMFFIAYNLIRCLMGASQLHPPGSAGTPELQRHCGRRAAICRGYRASPFVPETETTHGSTVGDHRPGSGARSAGPARTSRRQAPTQTLSVAQSSAQPLPGNPPPQSLLEKQTQKT
jgi:hypothetical protein